MFGESVLNDAVAIVLFRTFVQVGRSKKEVGLPFRFMFLACPLELERMRRGRSVSQVGSQPYINHQTSPSFLSENAQQYYNAAEDPTDPTTAAAFSSRNTLPAAIINFALVSLSSIVAGAAMALSCCYM